MAGAALDVFSEEPATSNVLFNHPHVVTTPHLGASSTEAQLNVAVDVAHEVVSVLTGGSARYAVNLPLVSADSMRAIAPFLSVAGLCGNLVTQLAEGQPSDLKLGFQGDIGEVDTAPLKAAVLGGLLKTISEERVSLVNASMVAQSHGLRITEQKGPATQNYQNLVTVEATTSLGTTTVSGTSIKIGRAHV